jgi:hypothetical protein
LTPRQYAAIKWQTAGGNEYDSKYREAEYEKAAFALTKTSEDPKKFQNHLKNSAFAERSSRLLDT